jgi:iron(III) transport system ATP-binding protein
VDFGIVFQSYALFPNLTVLDNVGYGLVSRRRPGAIGARQRAAGMVGLPDAGPKIIPPSSRSAQQQRVARARGTCDLARLLLLDEPLSALDARVRSGFAPRDQGAAARSASPPSW